MSTLLKDRSITTLLKSFTNSSGSDGTGAETPIQFVKGVGPKLGAVFSNREIKTVRDLLYFFPRTYEDRSHIAQISQLVEGSKATLTVRVLSQKHIPIRRLGKTIFDVRVTDGTGYMNLKWFYPLRGMESKFQPGVTLVVTGKIQFYQSQPQIVHPEITWGALADNESDPEIREDHHNVGRVVPVYVELDSVPTRTLRKVLWEATEKFVHTLEDELPAYLLEKYKLPSVREAVKNLHFPPDIEAYRLQHLADSDTPAHHRLIYGEFFKFQYLMLLRKLRVEKAQAPVFSTIQGAQKVQSLIQSLPFQLTQGQVQTLREIQDDFAAGVPMNRLVQGDVGSGKTAVAFLGAAWVLEERAQAALMAPTEILAEQHYKNALSLFQGKLAVALLTGKSTNSERNQLQARLAAGEPLLVIGTHALIEDTITFKSLSYVMIDEQHRFGVEQRRALRKKGVKKEGENGPLMVPHSLVLTATPIPRTLALTAFGDLAVSTIRELPPGRSPIQTKVIRDARQRTKAYQHIRKELKAGRQAYFIFPLVHDSEAEGFTHLKSAVAEAEALAFEIFPDFIVGLLHGQMNSEEKASVMERFKKGEVQILVSTTVVEVGVDVPNSTVMAIEHAERFGLSQLHQLRGRVGRGKFQSYCFLFSNSKSDTTTQRLEVLEETNDGFKIAEADLEIRGPGEFLGTRQAGVLPFQMAHLVRDRDWLMRARDDAMAVVREDPSLREARHLPLREYLTREGSLQFERLGTS